MAFKRKKIGKRTFKKKRFSLARRAMNPLGKGIPNQLRQIRGDIEGWFPVSMTQGGVAGIIQYAASVPLNYPGQYFSNAASWGTLPNISSGAYTRLVGGNALFDEYRVLRLVVKFYPASQYVLSADPAVDAPNIVYHYNDADDQALMTTEGNALNAGALPKFFSQHPVTFVYSQRNTMKHRYLNSQNVTVAPTAAAPSPANVPPEDSYGCMKLLIPTYVGIGATVVLGRMYCKWEVIARGIRPQSA